MNNRQAEFMPLEIVAADDPVRRVIRLFKQWRAQRRLQKITDARRESYAVRRYRQRREAAKLGIARKRAV